MIQTHVTQPLEILAHSLLNSYKNLWYYKGVQQLFFYYGI